MITLMIAVATQNTTRRGRGLPGVWWKILIAITATEVATQGLLLTLGITPPTPQYIIPINGMMIGNAMNVSGLLLNRLQSDVKSHQPQILTHLALGATPKQSMMPYLKQSIRASMIPTSDSAKTTGLVQLPGMMTGQIIAGADPIQTVRYQIANSFLVHCLRRHYQHRVGIPQLSKLFLRIPTTRASIATAMNGHAC